MAGQQEIDIVILVFGTLGMLILALALVVFVVFYQKKRVNQQIEIVKRENKYQHELLNATIEVKEKEQKRIALELHDDIGSALTAIKMQLSKKDLSQADITNSQEQLKEVVTHVRAISNDLLPPVLNELGLNGAISNLCRRLGEQTIVVFNTVIPPTKTDVFKKDEELAIYRIVQELLNNILKHAEATKIFVSVTITPINYCLILEDDGKGYTPPNRLDVQSTSLGLKNIASRVQQIDATLNYELVPTKGTKVTLTKTL